MFRLIRNEKGIVLVIALMILALLSVLSLTAILTTTTDMEISTNYKVLQTTFYNTEGSMDIAPGPIRRTISLKTESQAILDSLGITDSDGNGISDIDESSPFSNLSVDVSGTSGTPDFVESIMGYTTTAPPNFTININEMDITVSTTRTGPVQLKGFSTGFATGYEGGAMSGKGIDFEMQGTGSGDRNSQSKILLKYRCVERSGGGCL